MLSIPKIVLVVGISAVLVWAASWRVAAETPLPEPPPPDFSVPLEGYLRSKGSPLADDAAYVVTLEHWRLLVAVSAIESQFCKYQVSYNCWGIGGDSQYRHYGSFREAITDANDLIEHWQKKGRWLTVEDMNCHYVVPCNPNWVVVVNKILLELPR